MSPYGVCVIRPHSVNWLTRWGLGKISGIDTVCLYVIHCTTNFASTVISKATVDALKEIKHNPLLTQPIHHLHSIISRSHSFLHMFSIFNAKQNIVCWSAQKGHDPISCSLELCVFCTWVVCLLHLISQPFCLYLIVLNILWKMLFFLGKSSEFWP